MKLTVIDTGFFKLDGGAMFGVVPKSMWNRLNPADENNMCTWAMRCLLVETEDRKILIDTGLGDKQDEKFRSHFHPHGDASLLGSLAANGLQTTDITDVFLTHMHFDHVGGAASRTASGELIPTFPNAKYWSTERHLKAATNPNAREKASFLKDNIQPLIDHKVLHLIPEEESIEWLPNISISFANGHTDAMMIPHIKTPQGMVIYCADLMPSHGHIRLPYVMAYDIRPLDTLAERKRLYETALEHDAILFFEHDPTIECSRLIRDERGRVKAGAHGSLKEVLG